MCIAISLFSNWAWIWAQLCLSLKSLALSKKILLHKILRHWIIMCYYIWIRRVLVGLNGRCTCLWHVRMGMDSSANGCNYIWPSLGFFIQPLASHVLPKSSLILMQQESGKRDNSPKHFLVSHCLCLEVIRG